MMIKGIHHISMKCCNDAEYGKVKEFYTKVLGISILKECDACLLMDTGSGIVEIFRDGDCVSGGVIRHFALSTDDVEGIAATVENAGYDVYMKPTKVYIDGDPNFPATIAFCKGPLGEDIEFFSQEW